MKPRNWLGFSRTLVNISLYAMEKLFELGMICSRKELRGKTNSNKLKHSKLTLMITVI